MAATKISALASLTGALSASDDFFVIVDKSDTTMAASGTDKQITRAELKAALNVPATRSVSMLNGSLNPDTSGNCWQEPFAVLATNDVWSGMVYRFGSSNAAAPTTRIGLTGFFRVPDDYVGTCKIIPKWTATLTSGDVAWDLDYRTVSGNDTTSLDQSGTEESVTVTDTAPGAALRQLLPELSPTSANFAAGETVEWTLFRDGADAADTMAGSAILIDLLFQYAT